MFTPHANVRPGVQAEMENKVRGGTQRQNTQAAPTKDAFVILIFIIYFYVLDFIG